MDILIHIGAPKTGSSAIQSGFAKNAEPLARACVLYPDFASLEKARADKITSGNGVPLAKFFGAPVGDHIKTDHLLPEIRSAIGRYDKVVYSSEVISLFDLGVAARRYQEIRSIARDVRILIYVRSIAGHALSSYHQRIKSARTQASFEDFIRQDYAGLSQLALIERSVEAFGRDALVVRSYDADRADLFATCLRTFLGVDDLSGFDISPATVNRSLTDHEVAIMRVISPCFQTPLQARVASDAMIYGAPALKRRDAISPAAFDALTHLHGHEAAAISAFLHRQTIELMSDGMVVSDAAEPELSETEKALARMIAGVIVGSKIHAL